MAAAQSVCHFADFVFLLLQLSEGVSQFLVQSVRLLLHGCGVRAIPWCIHRSCQSSTGVIQANVGSNGGEGSGFSHREGLKHTLNRHNGLLCFVIGFIPFCLSKWAGEGYMHVEASVRQPGWVFPTEFSVCGSDMSPCFMSFCFLLVYPGWGQ